MTASLASVSLAKSIEDAFIQRFEGKLSRLTTVYCPLDGRCYDASPDDRRLFRRNRNGHVVETLKRTKAFERTLLKSVPLDEALHCVISSRSFFGRRTPRVTVVAAARTPLESLLRGENAPLGPLDIDEVTAALVKDPRVFYYVGICSTTSWASDAFDRLPILDNAVLCLVEPEDTTAWTVRPQADPRWGELAALFDPESDEEKITRTVKWLRENPTLSLRGGHLKLTDIAVEAGIDGGLLDSAIEQCTRADRELSVATIDGIRILKRARL